VGFHKWQVGYACVEGAATGAPVFPELRSMSPPITLALRTIAALDFATV